MQKCSLIRGKSLLNVKPRRVCNKLFLSTKGTTKKDVSRGSYPKAYQPSQIEDGWYGWWESQGYFKPSPNDRKYTILMPPPNVTGTLHLGHALTATIQDVLVRWRRMSGDSVLWVPGVDHAGIATQVVVEKHLKKTRNQNKFDLGKEKFIEEVWKWKGEKGGKILDQLRKLGVSADWSKQFFTMDPVHSKNVTSAFIRLFNAGLIQRSNELVNWSCALQSSISDIEVEWKTLDGPTMISVPGIKKPVEFGVMHHVAYPLHEAEGEIVVATTRPETILGDSGIALHPSDPRRSQLEGGQVWHPFRKCSIPIVFDDSVDPACGTGALKITPLHDATDFRVSQVHGLQLIQVFDEAGHVLAGHGEYSGVNRLEVRGKILRELDQMGLLRGRYGHPMQVPLCTRSGDVVEVMLKPQWILKCKNVAERAAQCVREGQLKLYPENYERVWYHWLDNIKDWNISRQLWWGHGIPAYHVRLGERSMWVAAESDKEAKQTACKSWNIADTSEVTAEKDPDVLDTWFSSALLPLDAVPGDRTISLMETGHDIIFFWVARMVMMSLLLTDKLPFNSVLLHGVICDADGHKMSKSLGNVIDPEDVMNGASLAHLTKGLREAHESGVLTEQQLRIATARHKKSFPQGMPECGTDALRFTLLSQNVHSSNVGFDVNLCHTNKLFCNKILQAVKFGILSMEAAATDPSLDVDVSSCSDYSRWMLSRLSACAESVDSSLQVFDFHLATQALKNLIYYELCDVYLEAVKVSLRERYAQAELSCLFHCLDSALRLLHPFMPYVTEELYQRMPGPRPFPSIMVSQYPKACKDHRDEQLELIVKRAQDVVIAIRKLNAQHGTKGKKPKVVVVTQDRDVSLFIETNSTTITRMARADQLSVSRVPIIDCRVQEQIDPTTGVQFV